MEAVTKKKASAVVLREGEQGRALWGAGSIPPFHCAGAIATDDYDEFPTHVAPIQAVETSPTFAGFAAV